MMTHTHCPQPKRHRHRVRSTALIAIAVALASCSGSQRSQEGPCLPINDWQLETRLSLSEGSVAALAWRPDGDPYASEQTL